MASGWRQSKAWSDRFLPELRAMCGLLFIAEPADVAEDQRHATDLIVLNVDKIRIGARVRQHRYLAPYPNDFTIRRNRPSGKDSELGKILAGWGDYLFYAFACEHDCVLTSWRVVDLKVFRQWFFTEQFRLPERSLPGKHYKNADGSSTFQVFNVKKLPSEMIYASGPSGLVGLLAASINKTGCSWWLEHHHEGDTL